MKAQQVIFIATVFAVAGCKNSTSTIRLDSGTLQLNHGYVNPDFIAVAVSPDGSELVGIDSMGFGLLNVETGSIRRLDVSDQASKSIKPILFSADGNGLWCEDQSVAPTLISLLDLRSGAISPGVVEPRDDPEIDRAFQNRLESSRALSPRNAQWTLVLFETAVFTNRGKVVSMRPVGFDQFGNAWGYKGKTSVEVTASGNVRLGGVHGPLEFDQTKLRGSFSLHQVEQELSYKGGNAYVSEVWIESARARPDTQDPQRAALVYAGADVLGECFVPHKKMVVVSSNRGTALVPYDVNGAAS